MTEIFLAGLMVLNLQALTRQGICPTVENQEFVIKRFVHPTQHDITASIKCVLSWDVVDIAKTHYIAEILR
jgi:hypothetical protein